MTEKPVLISLLEASAGVSDNAALVYKHILMVGSLTIGEVCEYTGLELGVVSKVLEELVNARLIRKLTHVVDRYVAVAPYRAFAEHLVEFQRAIKEVEENAKKSIDLTLSEISKTNEQFKANANKLKEEEVSRAKQEINQLKEEAETARRGLIEKLARETEAKKSSITETLKKHVDEHSTRILELREDTALRLDNSSAKFSETTAKLKEQASQSTASYLSRFEERIQAFVISVSDGLTTFQSGFYTFTENYERETSSFLEDFNAKAGELAETIKQKANDLMRGVGQSFSQLSLDLEKTVTNQVDEGINRSSSSNAELESSIKGVFQTNGEKLSQTMSAFQTEMQELMNRWRSTNKDESQNWLIALKETAGVNLENTSQKLEATKTPMSEVLRNYLTSAEGSSDELNSSINALVESIKKDLADEITSTTEELQESCDSAVKDCNSLVATLESLSKKSVPLTSKTLADFNLDIGGKLSKMFATEIENMKSFSEEVKQKVLKLVPTVTSPSGSGERTKRTGVTQDDLRKEISDRIDDIADGYIEAAKKSIDTSEKYTSTKMGSTMRFEEELEKKWGSVTTTIARVSDLTEAIKSFPQTLGKVVNELTAQYGKKIEATISSTRRLLNVHLKSLEDGTTNTLKKWGTTIEKTTKELSDISIKRQSELDDAITSHTNALETIAAGKTKELTDIVSKQIEALNSENLNAQELAAKHIASNTEKIGENLKNAQNNLKETLEATLASFNTTVESTRKENDDMSVNAINETSRTVTEFKEKLSSSMRTEKDLLRQICESAASELRQIASEYTKQLSDITSSLTNSLNETLNDANEGYKRETETTKTALITLLSQHIKTYAEAVNKVIIELNSTLAKHLEDCSALTQNFGKRFSDLLTLHRNKFEAASNRMTGGLITAIDQDEAALNSTSKKMLNEFTDNTTRTSKEASSTENLMRAAWAEITDTQQISADKTWHYVTKRAILEHVRDMVKRTKSTVTLVVPNVEEAPLKEIKEISRAIRIQIIAEVDENLHRKLLKELFMQGNVRIWSLTEKDYISCTRDAEEVLIAPVARKDIDCVATVSVEENYVKLYHKFIGPMWMASSREIKEKTLG